MSASVSSKARHGLSRCAMFQATIFKRAYLIAAELRRATTSSAFVRCELPFQLVEGGSIGDMPHPMAVGTDHREVHLG